jgi:hypothetical protein
MKRTTEVINDQEFYTAVVSAAGTPKEIKPKLGDMNDLPYVAEQTTFIQVLRLGDEFIRFLQEPEKVGLVHHIIPNRPLDTIFIDHAKYGNPEFWVVVKFGLEPNMHFPAVAKVVFRPGNNNKPYADLELRLVPIHLAALQGPKYQSAVDREKMQILAAAAATAAPFLSSMQQGIETNTCASVGEPVTRSSAQHAVPAVTLFDTVLGRKAGVIDVIPGGNKKTVQQLAHTHGVSGDEKRQIVAAAGRTQIASGIDVFTIYGTHIPNIPISYSTIQDSQSGRLKISPAATDSTHANVAMSLAMTRHVVGDNHRERAMEQILRPDHADAPLTSLLPTPR